MILSKRYIPTLLNVQLRLLSSKLQNGTPNDKIISIKLADIGEGIHEVELLRWFVKEGDTVKTFDKVCEVQSDKATVEITSRYHGEIKSLYHQEGSIVKVGDILVDLNSISDSTQSTAHDVLKPDISISVNPILENNNDIIIDNEEVNKKTKSLASPVVRTLAKDRWIWTKRSDIKRGYY